MVLADVIRTMIAPGLSLLPSVMDSFAARRMLVCIGLQESDFLHRRQIQGPARGWWQFEIGGTRGVLEHHASKLYAWDVAEKIGYRNADAHALYLTLEHNDLLASTFARLLLWRLPMALPETAEAAWGQYLDAWRPGAQRNPDGSWKPTPLKWVKHWASATEAVAATHTPVTTRY